MPLPRKLLLDSQHSEKMESMAGRHGSNDIQTLQRHLFINLLGPHSTRVLSSNILPMPGSIQGLPEWSDIDLPTALFEVTVNQ
jgi:hypothetical protein